MTYMPTVSICIASYRRDREWLRYCLRFLKKNAKGFHEVVVVLPEGDQPHFENFDYMDARPVWFHDPPGPGYCGQQYRKMCAHEYCSGDLITYVDSDTMLLAPTHANEFLSSTGKPIALLRHWSEVGDALIWKAITEKAVGFEPMFEYMACMPLVHDRRLLPILHEYMLHTHGKSLFEYVKDVDGRNLSEFNIMGAVSHKFLPHLYDWRISDPATDGYPRTFNQGWSWQEGGVEPLREKFERQLNESVLTPA